VGVQKDGSLWTWGRNVNGQLGDGTFIAKAIPTKNLSVLPNSDKWDKVASGNSHTIALTTSGVVYRWGGGSRGQLGLAATTDAAAPSTAVLNNCKFVAAGGDHSLAICGDGELYAWGANGFGQLGLSTTADALAPTLVAMGGVADRDWESVSAGGGHNDAGNDLAVNGGHTVAIKTDGTLWAWGSNYYGQLGLGTTEDQSAPVKVNNDTDWKRVSAGKLHTFAWKADGSLWGWGANLNGQLGNGSSGIAAKNILVPTRLAF
jgi:alpha-tubulin suppressor-like RCC1 family protein